MKVGTILATGQRVGYVRVSSVDQKTDRQLEGVSVEKTFIDKASGKDRHREQLEAMMSYVRSGDTVVVHSMDRLARNLPDLLAIVQALVEKDVEVEFHKENLKFSGENNPMSYLMLSIMGAVAQFERALINERQREGIALARKKGLYKGRSQVLSDDQQKELSELVRKGFPKTTIAKKMGIHRNTVYRYMSRLGVKIDKPTLGDLQTELSSAPDAI